MIKLPPSTIYVNLAHLFVIFPIIYLVDNKLVLKIIGGLLASFNIWKLATNKSSNLKSPLPESIDDDRYRLLIGIFHILVIAPLIAFGPKSAVKTVLMASSAYHVSRIIEKLLFKPEEFEFLGSESYSKEFQDIESGVDDRELIKKFL